MRDDLDSLEEVIVNQEGIDKHENGLRDPQSISGFPCGLRLEVLNTVVCNISDGATSEGGHFWDFDISVDSKFFLENSSRVSLIFFVRSSLDHLERV